MGNNSDQRIAMKKIIQRTVETIEQSKEEVYTIVEKAQNDVESIKREIAELQEEVERVIKEVDDLERKDKLMRQKLVTVSKGFEDRSESDIRETYEKANDIRVKFFMKQQEEKNIRDKRTTLELRLRQSTDILKSAENLISQVGIAISYIVGDLSAVVAEEENNSPAYIGLMVLEAQEEERKRVSREIHDGPAQSIANIVLKAEICKSVVKKDMEKGIEELESLKGIVRRTLKEIRKIIYDLRPMSIDDLGLIPTIRRFLHEFTEETGVEVEFMTSKITDEVESIVKLAVFRLIQENLNNIRKHSEATIVNIEVSFGTKYINLLIRDNGDGFDYEQAYANALKQGKSFGLVGIVERVNQLHGSIQYENHRSQGTEVHIKLPVNRFIMQEEYDRLEEF